ncbi:ribbon-helix-helix domain-containing protein [Oryzibacter oryziterrae]|uniref:ribbon-helix-helix domain-containing protein n=1 Tax=Oryzibacter oryziterrae TaxID=2766474 RepID=UPI001F38140F|nr:CopG family transcriptional regulator [Oryzibacter oryziterrae]
MRFLVDFTDETIDTLNQLSAERQVSRASIIRDAVDLYLAQQPHPGPIDGFGLWKSGEDGVAYRNRMRRSW